MNMKKIHVQHFISLLSDIFGKDLEAFARWEHFSFLFSKSVWKCIKMHPVTTGHNYSRHGKRSTVSAEDVKLLARRSTALVSSNVLYNGHIQHKTDS